MQKKRSTKEVYKGPIFTMTKDEVEIKGAVYERDIIHHHGGVGVLAIQDEAILLVKQYRYAIQQDTYEIPAGKLEAGEDPYTCGLRELEEESGFTTPHMHDLCAFYSTPGFCNEKIYIYWTKDIIPLQHLRPMDEDEEIEIVWIPLNQAYDMIMDGRIQDGKTIIAIQYAMLHIIDEAKKR